MNNKISTSDFVKRLIDIDNKYDYSLVEYENMHKKVNIICNVHGEFRQTPINLLNGFLCKKCKKEISKKNKLKNVLDKGNKIHNNKYDYSLVEYDKRTSNVTIICEKHGKFNQSLNNHINQKKGCPKCVKNFKLKEEDFIKKSNIIHNNKYDYSLINFINVATKVTIKCIKHGVFEQTPNNHMNGIGCPICKESRGEKTISKLLSDFNIKYIKQKKFKKCKDKRYLPFDFYLPEYNMCIESDGRQHFESFDFFGGYENFKIIKKHDDIKNQYCKTNNIKLMRINYKNDINQIINDNFKKIKVN